MRKSTLTKDFNSVKSFFLDRIASLKWAYVLLKCLRTEWAKATVTLYDRKILVLRQNGEQNWFSELINFSYSTLPALLLTENKIVGSENLSKWPRANRIHCPGLKIDKNRSWNVFAAWKLEKNKQMGREKDFFQTYNRKVHLTCTKRKTIYR